MDRGSRTKFRDLLLLHFYLTSSIHYIDVFTSWRRIKIPQSVAGIWKTSWRTSKTLSCQENCSKNWFSRYTHFDSPHQNIPWCRNYGNVQGCPISSKKGRSGEYFIHYRPESATRDSSVSACESNWAWQRSSMVTFCSFSPLQRRMKNNLEVGLRKRASQESRGGIQIHVWKGKNN